MRIVSPPRLRHSASGEQIARPARVMLTSRRTISRLSSRGPVSPGRWSMGEEHTRRARALRGTMRRERFYMRQIAIVGSGIAGLLTAHGLRRAGYGVTLFSDRTPEQWLHESKPTGTA